MLGIRLQGNIIRGIVPGSPAYYNNHIQIADEIVSVNGHSDEISSRINAKDKEGQKCVIALKSGRLIRLCWASMEEVNERLAVYEILSSDIVLLGLIEPFLKTSYQAGVTMNRILSKMRQAKIWSSWVQSNTNSGPRSNAIVEVLYRRRFRVLLRIVHAFRLNRMKYSKLKGQKALRSFILNKHQRKNAFQGWSRMHVERRKRESALSSIFTKFSNARSLQRTFFSLALNSHYRTAKTQAVLASCNMDRARAMHAAFHAWTATMCLRQDQRSGLLFLLSQQRNISSKVLLKAKNERYLVWSDGSISTTSGSPTAFARDFIRICTRMAGSTGVTTNHLMQFSSVKCHIFLRIRCLRMQVSLLQAWALIASEQRRHCRQGRKLADFSTTTWQRRRNQTLSGALRRLVISISMKIRTSVHLRNALARLRCRGLSRLFQAWQVISESKQGRREHSVQLYESSLRCLLRDVIDIFRQNALSKRPAKQRKDEHLRTEAVIRMMQLRANTLWLGMVFSLWAAVAATRSWRRVTQALTRRFHQRHLFRTLRLWLAWQQGRFWLSTMSCRIESGTRKALMRRVLHSWWFCWKSWMSLRVKSAQLVWRGRRRLLFRAWDYWNQWPVPVCTNWRQRLAISSEAVRGRLMKGCSIRAWYMWTWGSKAVKSAARRSCKAWLICAKQSSSLALKGGIIARRCVAFALMRILKLWAEDVQTWNFWLAQFRVSTQRARLLQEAVFFMRVRVLARGFDCWVDIASKRVDVCKSSRYQISVMRKLLKSKLMSLWKERTKISELQSIFVSKIAAVFCSVLLSKVIHGWALVSFTKSLKRKNARDILTRMRVELSFKMWSRWSVWSGFSKENHRLVGVLENAVTQIFSAKVGWALNLWKTFVYHKRSRRAMGASMYLSSVENVWSAWKGTIQKRVERRSLIIRASTRMMLIITSMHLRRWKVWTAYAGRSRVRSMTSAAFSPKDNFQS